VIGGCLQCHRVVVIVVSKHPDSITASGSKILGNKDGPDRID